jgi:hypothetical protein
MLNLISGIQYLIQQIAHVTVMNHLLLCDAALTNFTLNKVSGKSFTKEYSYNSFVNDFPEDGL